MQRLCHVGDPLRSVLRYRVRPRGFCGCSDPDPRPRPRPMGSSPAGGGGGGRDPSAKPAVAMLREIVSGGGGADGWEKSWELGMTPWDLGKPTPIVEHLVQSGTLPKGRALVPGCGMGYDVVALASPDRFVVGLDISDIAVKKAKQWSSSLPNVDCFTFLVEDFFSWTPSEKFDLIFDYIFFCAIHPSLRMAWAETVSRHLKPEGELITLIYLISDQDGPPYNNTVADYHEILEPLGFKAVLMEDNALAVKPRKVLGYSAELLQTKTLHVALDGISFSHSLCMNN